MVDQIKLCQNRQQILIALDRDPGCKRDKGRIQRQSGIAAEADDLDKILPRVALVQKGKHAVINRLHRTCDKETPGLFQGVEVVRMLHEVLNLHRHVIGELGKLLVQCSDECQGMTNPIEKVGVAKGDVLCTWVV